MRDPIKVALAVNEPYVNPPNASSRGPGINVDTIKVVISLLGRNASFTYYDDFPAAYGAVAAGVSDMTGWGGTLLTDAQNITIDNIKLSQEFDLLTVQVEKTVLVTRRPTGPPVAESFLIFRVLQWQVWLVLLSVYAMVRVLAVRKLCGQSTKSKALIFLFWGFFMNIFLNIAGAYLAIALSKAPLQQRVLNSQGDLVPLLMSKQCKLITINMIAQELQNLMADTNVIDSKPVILNDTSDVGTIHRVLESKECFVGIMYSHSLIAMDNEKCKLDVLTDKPMSVRYYYSVVRKSHPQVDQIRMAFAGITNHDDYLPHIYHKYLEVSCEKTGNEKFVLRPLAMSQLTDCFAFLATGIVVAALAGLVAKGTQRFFNTNDSSDDDRPPTAIYQFEKNDESVAVLRAYFVLSQAEQYQIREHILRKRPQYR